MILLIFIPYPYPSSHPITTYPCAWLIFESDHPWWFAEPRAENAQNMAMHCLVHDETDLRVGARLLINVPVYCSEEGECANGIILGNGHVTQAVRIYAIDRIVSILSHPVGLCVNKCILTSIVSRCGQFPFTRCLPCLPMPHSSIPLLCLYIGTTAAAVGILFC